MANKAKKSEESLIREYRSVERQLKSIYSNKSSDEYKMHGDITLAPNYSSIEKTLADLEKIKGFDKTTAREFNTMFSTLHRPIFKRMVSEYMHEPTETNVLYTTTFTVGYRVLVGELSRILASTEATDNGLVYKPGKISEKKTHSYLIKHYNNSLETGLSAYIRTHGSDAQKAAIKDAKKKDKVTQEGALADLATIGFEAAKFVCDAIQAVFSFGAKEFNPISFFNAVLMKSYDKKIQKFEDAKKEYELAKEAYEDYLKLPKSDRKRRVEHKYAKLITKYNIKMQHLKAKIEHFDERSEAEAREKREKMKEDRIIYGNDDDDEKESSSSDSSSSSSSGGSAYDFDF